MLRPTWPLTRLAIPQADEADFSRSISERLIKHRLTAGKGIFASGRRPQVLRHYVPTLDAGEHEKTADPQSPKLATNYFRNCLISDRNYSAERIKWIRRYLKPAFQLRWEDQIFFFENKRQCVGKIVGPLTMSIVQIRLLWSRLNGEKQP